MDSQSLGIPRAVLVHWDSLYELKPPFGIKDLNFQGLRSWLCELGTPRLCTREVVPVLATRTGFACESGRLADDVHSAGFAVTTIGKESSGTTKRTDPVEHGLKQFDMGCLKEVVLLTIYEAHVPIVRKLAERGVRVILVSTAVPCRKDGQWRLSAELGELLATGVLDFVELSKYIGRFCARRLPHPQRHTADVVTRSTVDSPEVTLRFGSLNQRRRIELLNDLSRLEAKYPGLKIVRE